MRYNFTRRVSLATASALLLIGLAGTVLAGPPLLCWPYDVGGAKSLPWGGSGWHDARTDYNLANLTGDTLALLTPEVPVIVRMETLRRATIYAMKDQQLTSELSARLHARVRKSETKGKANALALFDLGYFTEACKQARDISRTTSTEAELDGYSFVVKALQIRGNDPEMEFGAALISLHPSRRDKTSDHLRKALAGASEGSLLARNLVTHFPDRGKTLAELRASAGIASN